MINTKQSIQAAARKITNMLSRAIVKRITPTTGTQSLQVSLMEGEIRDNLEHPQEFGFTSVAPVGSEAIAAFFGGNRDHGSVLVVFNKETRPKDLNTGETCLYNVDGCKILLKTGGNIEIIAPNQMTITSPTVTLSGNLNVKGDITDKSDSNARTLSGMRSVFNAHKHTETGQMTQSPTEAM